MSGVVIVGGGAAGLGVALSLVEAGEPCTILEQEPRLGGHCFAVDVPTPAGPFRVDAGVSDFNRASFIAVRGLLERLGMKAHRVRQDVSFAFPDGSPVWSSVDGERRVYEGITDAPRFFADVDRFNATSVEVTADDRYADWTARRYLDEGGYGDEFRSFCFGPRAAGCFPMPDYDPEDYLIRPLVAFWQMHGIVGPGPAERMVLDAGMHAWPEALARGLKEGGVVVRRGCRVLGVARRPRGVRVRLQGPAGTHETHWFEHVVFATNPHEIRSVLEDPTHEEASLLGALHWQRARVVVHQDASLMPSDPSAWGAYNYVVAEGDEPEVRPTITFYPNRLASLPPEVPDVFVTINPHRQPARVLAERFFVHPSLSRPRDLSVRRLASRAGTGNTWFAGGWLRVPHVHEQALCSGLDTGKALAAALAEGEPSRPAQGLGDWLRESPVFAPLDASLLDEIRLVVEPFTRERGELLCAEGDEGNGMFFLTEGEVEIQRRGLRLATRGPQSLVGELALLDGRTRVATVTAKTRVRGYFFSSAAFDELRRDTRPAAFAVLDRIARGACERLRAMLSERWGRSPPKSPRPFPPQATPQPDLPAPFELPPAVQECGVALPEGALLYDAGAPADSMFLIAHGVVEASAPSGEVVTQLMPGDFAGALGVLDGGRHALSFRALTDVTGFRVDAASFRALRYGGTALAGSFVTRVHAYLVTQYRPLFEEGT